MSRQVRITVSDDAYQRIRSDAAKHGQKVCRRASELLDAAAHELRPVPPPIKPVRLALKTRPGGFRDWHVSTAAADAALMRDPERAR